MNVFLLYQAHMAEGSKFNFQKFLARTFDEDFEVVVGIRLKTPPLALVYEINYISSSHRHSILIFGLLCSFWIWIFSIFFIFFSAHSKSNTSDYSV